MCGRYARPAGTILWKTRLSDPEVARRMDGGVPLGVLGTPIVDLSTSPARVYVASDDASAGWRVFALDLTSAIFLAFVGVDRPCARVECDSAFSDKECGGSVARPHNIGVPSIEDGISNNSHGPSGHRLFDDHAAQPSAFA